MKHPRGSEVGGGSKQDEEAEAASSRRNCSTCHWSLSMKLLKEQK